MLVRRALTEDRAADDLTSALTMPPSRRAKGVIVSHARGVVAGLMAAGEAFRVFDRRVRFRMRVRDGARVTAGQIVATVEGPARSILAVERVALNFLQHLSGIATLTRRCVDRVRGTRAVIKHTRKTIPGVRVLQLHAVCLGGGARHRRDLGSGVLIKDNHLAAAGARGPAAVSALVRAARERRRRPLLIEVEVQDVKLLRAVLDAGADIVMLDNLSPTALRHGVRFVRAQERRTGRRIVVEASGGVTPDSVRRIARTGVDWISIGALTHSAPALDFSLDLMPE